MNMSQTEKLLQQAMEIAERTFSAPGEESVMKIFSALSYEVERAMDERGGERAVMH
jgi:hypothetical protein